MDFLPVLINNCSMELIISSNLRSGSIPILNYINNDRVFIDLKAIPDDQINELISTMKECL